MVAVWKGVRVVFFQALMLSAVPQPGSLMKFEAEDAGVVGDALGHMSPHGAVVGLEVVGVGPEVVELSRTPGLVM